MMGNVLGDLLMVALLLAFLGLASLLVVACDRVIGPGNENGERR